MRFQGLAEPHATIKLVEGASTLKTTEAGDAGAWVIDLTDIPDGVHTYSLTATDRAANESDAATRTVTVDTDDPDTPTITAGPNGPVNTASPQFSFTGETSATFECALDTGDFEPCTSPKPYSGLAEGNHVFGVRQIDAAGNGSDTRTRSFSVDFTPPGAPAIAPMGALQNGRTVNVSGTAEGGATVAIAEGATKLAEVTASVGGAWARALQDVVDGAHTYSVTATDAAGNVSSVSSVTVTVDTVAPQTTLTIAPSGVTKVSRPTFEFASEPGARFECRIDGAYADCASPFVSPTLADGAHRFFVRAIDAAGNVGAPAQSSEFTVDTTAPAAPVISATVSGGDASFRVDAEAGATLQCRVDSGAWAACASTYSGFAPGAHLFEARAVDAAGNVGPVARYDWTVAGPVTPPAFQPTIIPPTIDPAPVITVAVSRQRLATVLRSGLSIRLGCSPACRTTLVLAQGRSVAARRTATAGAAKAVRVKLSAATRKRLAKARSVTLTVTVSAPGAQTVTRKIVVKR